MRKRFSGIHLKRPLLLILAAYLLLATGFSIINPLFEAPDEHWHYFTAQYIADSGELPYVAEDIDTWMGQEAAQPPLYYFLGAQLIRLVDTTGARDQVWLNPFAWIGDASALANINQAVHASIEDWPWHGYALAAHLLRGMSILFGLGTLLAIYGSGRLLWPDAPAKAVLATSLAAFLPQFLFIHSSVSNDSLITFLSSAALWQLLRMWQGGESRHRLLLLGATIGLAALSKSAGILLLAYAVGVLILMSIRDQRPKLLAQTAALVILPVILTAGWLWWRNWQLYGDFTAANQFVKVFGGDREYTLLQILGESNGLWLSFFAIFGWFNVRAPEWIYLVWNLLFLISAAGIGWSIYQQRTELKPKEHLFRLDSLISLLSKAWAPAGLLAVWLLVVYAGLVTFMMKTYAAQGRLLFPAILPIMLGLAYGLGRIRWRGIYIAAASAAFATAAYCLFFVIAPAYALPDVIDQLPEGAAPINQEMGQGLRIVAAAVETTIAKAGEPIWFTIYWTADQPLVDPPEFVFELFGRQLARIGNLHAYHGSGLFPANLWPTDRLVADRFAVRLDEKIDAPVQAWAQVRLAGEDAAAQVGTVKIIPETWPQAADSVLADLDGIITLRAVSLSHTSALPGELVGVDLQWQVKAAPAANLTTLVHLGEAGQPPAVTGDSPPLSGNYPTKIWAAGEVIDDGYKLSIPADLAEGRYPIWIGMYDSNTMIRLPLHVQGQRQPNDVYLAGWLTISR